MNLQTKESPYTTMPSHWRCVELSQLCEIIQTGPFGSLLHQSDYVEQGTPIITVNNIGEGQLLLKDISQVSDEDWGRLSRFHLQTDDIVFSRVGAVDRNVLINEEQEGWLFSGSCLRVRVDRKVLDSKYLSCFFELPKFREYINKIALGATRPSLKLK